MSNIKTAKQSVGRTLEKSSVRLTNAVHMNVSARSLSNVAQRIQRHSKR